MKKNNENKSCPSSTCSDGALLLGKVKENGTVGFFENSLPLDAASFQEFVKLGEPERFYRFSSPCVQNGCRQWNNGACTVIQRILDVTAGELPPNAPKCMIRKTCRWFHQEGVEACYACAFVITDITLADNG